MLKIYFISLISVFCFSNVSGQAQIKRQTLSSFGSSAIISSAGNELVVQQVVGQQSVSGLGQNNGSLILQGFIQPEFLSKTISQETSSLLAEIYPNPFNSSINIALGELTSSPLHVQVVDVTGRLVFEKKIPFIEQLNIKVDLLELVTGSYIVTLTTNYRSFSTTLIKS